MSISFIEQAPSVFVVGAPQFNHGLMQQYLDARDEDWNEYNEDKPTDAGLITEAAGRVCYQSWANPGKKTNEEYIQSSIIEHKHGSVLEHAWFNMLVLDLPRSSQLELVRHGEGTGFSFESTRFTDKHMRFVVPPLYRKDGIRKQIFKEVCELQATKYRLLVGPTKGKDTLEKKREKEAARSILGNALGSDGMVSVNLRAARHIIQMRTDEHADQSIREFAFNMYRALTPYAGAAFADALVIGIAEGVPPIVKFNSEKV